MRYFVDLEPPTGALPGNTVVVDILELPSGALDVCVDGQRIDVDVASVAGAGDPLSVRVGGRMVDLTTEGAPPELGAVASGHRSYVRVESERQRAASAAKKGPGELGDKVVKAPMPGRVIRLLVAKNDDVAAGQTLCVIEAMKMENEVKAKASCTVLDIHISEGATVEGNAKLFTLA